VKLLGLIGGVSPESTVIYYRLLNQAVRARLGGEHSANIVLYTLDYGTMIGHYDAGDWPSFIAEVVKGAKHLAAAGAEALVISSNTTHVAAEAAQEATGLPLIHLLDALTDAMNSASAKKPLLLGTPVVMSGDHYLPALAQRYDGEVLVPTAEEQTEIGRIILDELVKGEVREPSRAALQAIIARHDADGVILGCTELCMILSQKYVDLPVFDTTALHAAAVSAYAFGEDAGA
jgi:aspartate racemase